MAYAKKKETKEVKGNERIDVETNIELANDLVITKLSYYPINKKGIIAKASATINDCLVLDNILIRENSEFISVPSHSYESNGEKKFANEYFFIIKGVPKDFGNAIIDEYYKVTK